jgi:hypothetical protein
MHAPNFDGKIRLRITGEGDPHSEVVWFQGGKETVLWDNLRPTFTVHWCPELKLLLLARGEIIAQNVRIYRYGGAGMCLG